MPRNVHPRIPDLYDETEKLEAILKEQLTELQEFRTDCTQCIENGTQFPGGERMPALDRATKIGNAASNVVSQTGKLAGLVHSIFRAKGVLVAFAALILFAAASCVSAATQASEVSLAAEHAYWVTQLEQAKTPEEAATCRERLVVLENKMAQVDRQKQRDRKNSLTSTVGLVMGVLESVVLIGGMMKGVRV